MVTCSHPNPKRKRTTLEGEIVLVCRNPECRMVSVEGADRWVNGDDSQVIRSLELLAAIKNEEAARWAYFMGLPSGHPAWDSWVV